MRNVSVAFFLAGRIKGRLRTFDMQKDANLTKTPTKIYSPDQFCRLCQCNIAIVGRGKCNIFSGKSSDGLARRLSIVLDAPVEKEDSVSSNVCYKCKREMEKYEGYMKALNVDLKAFRERCEKSVGEQRSRQHVPVKRCLRGTPTATKENAPKRRFTSSSELKTTAVRPLLPAPVKVNRESASEIFVLPSHDDLFIATTPGSTTEVCNHKFCYCVYIINLKFQNSVKSYIFVKFSVNLYHELYTQIYILKTFQTSTFGFLAASNIHF